MGIPLLPLRSSTIGAAAHSRSERQREEWLADARNDAAEEDATTAAKTTKGAAGTEGTMWRRQEPLRTDCQPSDRPTNTNARAKARCLPQGACDRRQRAAAVESRTALVLAFANHRQAYDADQHKTCATSHRPTPP